MDQENQDGNDDDNDNDAVSDPENPENQERRRSSKNKNVKENNKGCCGNFKLPESVVKASDTLNDVCDNPIFEKTKS
jgi:hypothetical protein